MADPGHIEPQAIATCPEPSRGVHLDQRRPAAGPLRQPLDRRCIALGIGKGTAFVLSIVQLDPPRFQAMSAWLSALAVNTAS